MSALWSQGVFSKVYVFSNHGDHWTPIGHPPCTIFDVQMDAATTGWCSRWNPNMFDGIWEMYAFSTGRNDWDKAGEAPFNCKPVRVDEGAPVICFSSEANAFELLDGVWMLEFSAR